VESCTLSDLRAKCRLYADERVAGYLTDATSSIDLFINDAAREFRQQVLSRPGGRTFWELRETFPLLSGTSEYKIDGTDSTNGTDYQVDSLGELHLQWSTTSIERVDEVPPAEWERIKAISWSQQGTKGYRLGAGYTGTTWSQMLCLAPTPTTTTTASIGYVPTYRNMTVATDTIVGPSGMSKAISCLVGIQMKGMQNEQTGYLEKQLAQAMAMVDSEIQQRKAAFHPRVVDVRPEQRHYDPRRYLPPA